MIQDILTFTTVGAAFIYASYSVYKVFFNKDLSTTCAAGCSSCEEKAFLFKTIRKNNSAIRNRLPH